MTLNAEERKQLVEPDSSLSVREQAKLFRINRSNIYYRHQNKFATRNEEIKAAMAELFLEQPFIGANKIAMNLKRKGFEVGKKLVLRLRKELNILPIGHRPKGLSKPRKEHMKYPYLLKGIEVSSPNQVWASDITYIPTPYGHLYLSAIVDWHSRKILSWKLSNTMTAAICITPMEEALTKFGKPRIFNSDQGSQYTSEDFIKLLDSRGINISMNGKGRCLDNIIIERFWRSIKYEMIFTHEFVSMKELNQRIANYIKLFNERRLHQSLSYRTPDEVYQMVG